MENIQQRTEAWLEQRKGRITASAVGAIMGQAPYAKREDVLRRMIREYFGYPNEFEGNVATNYGTFHEAGAIAEFEMETGLKVEPAPFVPAVTPIGKIPIGASPDGYVSDGKLIEVKCPYGLRNGGEFKSIKEQPHYYFQIQMQLYCTGKSECYFFQYSPYGTTTEIVNKDEVFLLDMFYHVDLFYEDYLAAIESPDKYLTDNSIMQHTDETLIALMNEYLSLKQMKSEIEERQKELINGMVALTDNEGGEIAGHKLYKTVRAGSISYAKAINELMPDADLEPYRGKPTDFWSVK